MTPPLVVTLSSICGYMYLMDGKDLVLVFSVLRNIRFITAPIKCHVSNVANIKVYHGYFDIDAIDFLFLNIVHYLNINNVIVGTLVKHPART